MLKNATYNLMETATVISKGLHRYDQFMKDSHDCQDCQRLWQQMRQADQQQLDRIMPHLKSHLDHESGAREGKLSAA